MYSNLPNLVLAFHGCDEDTFEKVLYKHGALFESDRLWKFGNIEIWI